MRSLVQLIFLLAIFSCNSDTTQEVKHSEPLTNPCEAGRDTINIKTVFTKDSSLFPTQRLYSVIEFIKGKGLFRPHADKTDKLKIKKEYSKTFLVAYDTCNHNRWIEKNFILTNMNVATVDFKATRPDKYSGLTPWLHLEEWKFANNSDRDNAMKIVQTAYQYPDNIVMYEKRYSQFILDDKRIFLLEARAKFAEQYAIDYKKFIEMFLNGKTNNNR
jgi:hypothetical protein